MKRQSQKVFIISAVRTPIGKFGGAFKDIPAVDLGVIATKEAIKRANIKPNDADELIFGHARLAGCGPNPARQVAVRSQIPEDRPAYTVNMACISGMKAIMLGCQEIVLGKSNLIVAGGMENMSRTPHLLEGARWGYRLGGGEVIDAMYRDGFLCPLAGQLMGETAENLVDIYKIKREECDEFAYFSHKKAQDAIDNGKFKDEIVEVELKDKTKINVDENVRGDVSLEKLSKLKPVFRKDGVVTAGNACGIADGSSALILASEEKVKEYNLQPMAEIIDYETSAVDPKIMGIAPVSCTKKLLLRSNLTFDDIDLIELNEAFAAQVLACERELKYSREKRNIYGGAVALGHPIGCSGARIVVTLLCQMKRKNKKLGIATLCGSGGLGGAILLKGV